MAISGQDLSALSSILLDLYDSASPADGEGFRLWALERLRGRLPFTGAAWAYGVVGAKGVVLHRISMTGLSPQFADAVRAMVHLDPTSAKMAAASGRSFVHSRADYPEPMLRHIAEIDDLQSSLEGLLVDPATQLFGSVGLFRNSILPPFSEAERLLHENLMLHWLNAPSRRLIAQMNEDKALDVQAQTLTAVCDARGAFEAATKDFVALIRREWPSWSGGAVPNQLLKPGASIGTRIGWSVAQFEDRLVVRVRALCPADKLSRRERQIATFLADGHSAESAAAKLKLSPSTVRNHRDRIYSKLEISNRLALADAMKVRNDATD